MYEEDWVTDCDWYNIYTDAERQEWYNKANGSEDGGRNLWYDYACGICAELISKINGEIESQLLNVDNTFGTHYCPTGYQRLY